MGNPAVFISGGVGGEESKGKLLVLTLHQVKKDPLRHPQILALLGQIEGGGAVVRAYLPGEDPVKFPEGPFQPGAVYVLRANGKGDCPKQTRSLLV